MTEIDHNKTALTQRITATAAAYLDSIGCKPIETEVGVAPGWVADLVTFVYPTYTEWKKAKLHKRFVEKGEGLNNSFLRWIAKHGYLLTVLAEVKTTVADFKKDLKRKFEASYLPAHLCYVVGPASLSDEFLKVPRAWGTILTTEDGQRIRKVSCPLVNPIHPGDAVNLVAGVAMRRDSRTRGVVTKAMLKAWNAKESERRKGIRINGAVRALCAWLTGKGAWRAYNTLEEAFRSEQIKMNWLSEEHIRELERVKNVMENQ